ncbi:MAG: copper resistance protein CopC [Candidatus Palauibacterales bacterium]|nr:copper resistance protein CopC [Candidatus Palauibacterales bacterium]
MLAGLVTAITGLAWASVHTRLESSVPSADEVLSTPPERFELRFSEPVNVALSEFLLISPAGDSMAVALDAEGDDRILVGDVPLLENGRYGVRWRTVSADGHPVSGEFGFTLSVAAAESRVPANSAADSGAAEAEDITPTDSASILAGRDRVPNPTDLETAPPTGAALLAGLALIAVLGFAGILWYCGALPLLREPRIARAVWAFGWAALLLGAADLIAWVIRVVPPGAGLESVRAAVGSNTGLVSLGRLALLGVALGTLRRWGRAAAGLALGAVLIGAASGHAAATSSWITMPANAVHLGAVSLWLGGLLLLVVAPDGPTDGSNSWHFGGVARAVSGTALLAVLLVVASGTLQSALYVGNLAALTGTTYGRFVLAKSAGLVVLVAFGAHHRYRVMPHLDSGGEGRVLRRTVRLETIVMLAVVLLGAWLARISPPAAH